MKLDLLPKRAAKPRSVGITMVMDKGLGIRQAKDLAESAGHLIDFIKLGFGTSLVSGNVREKARIYRDHDIRVYVGGTLFEAFLIRGQLDDYRRYIDDLGCDAVEISDGSIRLDHHEKCRLIGEFKRNYVVLSEVGAKDGEVEVNPDYWAHCMNTELEAGSAFVIGEARESGTVGLYGSDACADTSLVEKIIKQVPAQRIIWEAPLKNQQTWFIKLLGSEVSLGNIAPAEAIALETLRLGLRGDTFFDFLPESLQQQKLTGPGK